MYLRVPLYTGFGLVYLSYWPLVHATRKNKKLQRYCWSPHFTTAPTKAFPACCVFTSRSLATASNSENNSVSRAHVVTVWRISSLVADPKKHRLQQFLYCCYGRLPSDSPDVVDVFTDRYQATHVPSRDRCLATVLHATLWCWTIFLLQYSCSTSLNGLVQVLNKL
jgi:hypothetical protein